MTHPWIADRTAAFDSSGIRKIFDLAMNLKDPINLSIGQPDFDVPQPIRAAAVDAISNRKNAYTPTQGIAPLREKLQARIDQELEQSDRRVYVSSGTSGGFLLTMLSLVNPGDEVIFFDPFFVMYDSITKLAGGVPVVIDTYPDFRIDVNKVAAAITPKTKMILLNTPCNPTGVIPSEQEVRDLAELAKRKNIALVSDELYRMFCYDAPFVSPAKFNDQTIVIDGFSKSHAMTGWRLGFVHGPAAVIDVMLKLQQFTFVCAPQPVQWAGITALDQDMTPYVDAYRKKRDQIVAGLSDVYELAPPAGAFYAFAKAPIASGAEFVTRAIEHNLLMIPGKVFSRRDSHFRISYAVDDRQIERGIEVLRKLAKG
jgi:aspartate/methionine/tyrosine aminotransferase